MGVIAHNTKNNQTHLPWLLSHRLIPWAQDNIWQRIIVAHPDLRVADLPTDVSMERRKMRGKRVIMKGKRRYGNTRTFTASWPDDDLIEMESSKLICVLNGQADYQVGEYLLHVGAGHFIFMPPGTPHPGGDKPHLEGAHREKGACDLLQIVPYRRGIQCWICQSRGQYHSGLHTENYLIRNEQIIAVYHLMMEEAIASSDNHEQICESLLGTFLMMLQREINAGRYLLPGPRVTQETSIPSGTDFLTELNEYVIGHLQEQLTLESVARQMHLSRAQFARRIRQQTGQTFIAYLTERRLEEARILLRESEWTAIAISEFVGFQSSTYFHRLFRERMKMTPGEYRQKTSGKHSKQLNDTKGKSVRR